MNREISATIAVAAIVLIASFAYLSYYKPSGNVISTNGNFTTSSMKYGTLVAAAEGQRIDNFLIISVNQSNSSVSGLLYAQYPAAQMNGKEETIYPGEIIGYSCDGTLASFVGIEKGSAVFKALSSKAGACPV